MPKKSGGNKRSMNEVESIETVIETTTVKQAMVKALVISGRAGDSALAERILDERSDAWDEVQAVNPILDPESLMSLYEISDVLRQNVDAYVTNVEGNGHVLEPKIDPDKDDSFQKVKNAMDAAAWADAVTAKLADMREEEDDDDDVEYTLADRQAAIAELEVPEPTDAEVRARVDELRLQVQREMHTAKAWFRNVHPSLSFLELRERKRVDEESIGHGCWEVIRDDNGFIRRIEPMSSYTVLPVKGKGQYAEVEGEEWVSEIETRPVKEQKRFRLYVQRVDGRQIYYKDLNDPRLVSNKTGNIYMKEVDNDGQTVLRPDPKKMKKEEPEARPATELIYFAIYSPKTTAGMVRWAGTMTAIIGSRAAAVANLAYFENHAIPDAVLMVSGGQLNNESVQRIQEALRSKTKGAHNHHRTLVVQASAKSTQPNQVVNNPDMEWVNLSNFQQGDALFQGYTENNKTTVSSAFRQALLLIGHIPSDLNRATAYAILNLVEKQVYGPLRNKFDWWVNNTLLPSIGVYLLTFKSLSPEATNIEEMAKSIEQGVKGGAFTPNHLLSMYGSWLNIEFPKIEAPWGDVPFAATLSQLNLDAEPPADEDDDDAGQSSGADAAGNKTKGKNISTRLKLVEGMVGKLAKQLEKDGDFAEHFGE